VRDKCAVRKWPRFADQMIAALSSMFTQAVKRGKMPFNPATVMDKAHTADPHSGGLVVATTPRGRMGVLTRWLLEIS
jgi:hypothetical protein